MVECAVCGQPVDGAHVLCSACAGQIAPDVDLCPEQIVSRVTAPSDAALVDPWGRVHRIADTTVVGRQVASDGIAILSSSVSRRHAELRHDPTLDTFVLRDLGSTNGTVVGDIEIDAPTALRPGDRVTFGTVGFYFVADTVSLTPELEPAHQTVRPADFVAPAPAPGEDTLVGLPTAPIRVVEASGGGGGFVEVMGRRVQLTPSQLELVRILIDRMQSEAHQPEPVRGFVHSTELIARLPWDTPHPTDNHLKQLVRRVRRALVKAGVGNLIHSQHRLGYRLRVVPSPPAGPPASRPG